MAQVDDTHEFQWQQELELGEGLLRPDLSTCLSMSLGIDSERWLPSDTVRSAGNVIGVFFENSGFKVAHFAYAKDTGEEYEFDEEEKALMEIASRLSDSDKKQLVKSTEPVPKLY